MKEYVRLTYKPAGASRRRTVWAVVVRRTPERVTYLQCDEEGETTRDGGTLDGKPVERTHLIICTPAEVTEKPARMNNVYAMLEVVE
jgi:hypothetical protein